MSWVASIVAIMTLFLMTRRIKWAPIFGVFSQCVWFVYIFVDKQYGLAPCTAIFMFIYLTSIKKWWREG